MITLSGAAEVSDPGIDSPSDLAGDIWEWWEPSREAFADNDPIDELTGQFAPGSGHNFTQSTSGERPTYKASILNGHGVARFDGVDNWLHNVNTTSLSEAHVFVVVKSAASPSASGDGGLWSGPANPAYAAPGTPANTIHESLFRTTRVADLNAGVALTSWRVYEVISTASEYTLKIDGTQFFTGSGSYSDDSDLRLGNNGPFFTEWFNGDVAGMYFFSAKLSAGDRTLLIDYLNDRFGLSVS